MWAAVAGLLLIHAGLLASSATRHSPTLNEPGHLVAGLIHWKFDRFEVYRVNPPLTHYVAAIPVILAGYEEDWSGFYDSPGARPEFQMGEDFIRANGERSIWLFTLARWACIPISLIGGTFCFLWAREIYGTLAGLLALALWCFDPNILAHAELITSDAAATAFGVAAGYAFWRWLRVPSWGRASSAGLLLGLAQLAKMSWLFLFGLWPLLWIFWQLTSGAGRRSWLAWRKQGVQLAAVLMGGLYLLNLGYGFDGSFTPLKEFTFISKTLAGEEHAGEGGNRFGDSRLGRIPVPLPKQHLLGLDSQKRDFELYSPSYLRGEWKDGGWWYYYLYGCLVKVPHGTQLLLLLAVGLTVLVPRLACWRDELVLLAPAVVLFTVVSAQTNFNHHFRYVLPSLGILLVFLGKASDCLIGGFRSLAWHPPIAALAGLFVMTSVISSLRVHPHSLAYFNELAGGPENGYRHLLYSNLDWQQDFLMVRNWMREEGLGASDVNIFSSFPYHARALVSPCAYVRHSEDVPSAPWEIVSSESVFEPDSPWRGRVDEPSTRRIGHTIWAFPAH